MTYEVLSLGVIRNALASLTQAELIRQPSSEFEGTGKHRLVKVAKQDKLVELDSQLCEFKKLIIFLNYNYSHRFSNHSR